MPDTAAAGHALTDTPGLIALKLGAVLILVLANAFFVASEFALVSVRKTRIDHLAARGSASAQIVQRAIAELDRYVAATQVGITISSLLLGGLGEHVLRPLFLPLFQWMPPRLIGVTHASLAAGLAYFIMTALHVIVGELMPKSIALQKTDVTALWIGRPMLFFSRLFTPLIWILNGAGNFLLGLMGFKPAEGHSQVHSAAELDLLFAQSHQGGEINATQFDILHRVLRFSEISVRAIMVPRVEMRALPVRMKWDEFEAFLGGVPHMRVPIFRESLDDIVGTAHWKVLDQLRHQQALQEIQRLKTMTGPAEENAPAGDNSGIHSGEVDLSQHVREILRVPETMTIDRLLIEFKRHRQHMAIVIDEYGGTAGVITVGDIMEQAFGDIHDETQSAEAEIQVQPDGRVRLAGRVLIDDINERFELGLESEEVDTMAGLVLATLGRPARVGDQIEIDGAVIRVEAVDRLRITTLLLKLPD